MLNLIIEKNVPIPAKLNPGSKWGSLKNYANKMDVKDSIVFYVYDFLTNKDEPCKADIVTAVKDCENASNRLGTFIRRKYGKGSYKRIQLPFLAREDNKYVLGATVQGYRIWRIK